jgi:hypothetical protein
MIISNAMKEHRPIFTRFTYSDGSRGNVTELEVDERDYKIEIKKESLEIDTEIRKACLNYWTKIKHGILPTPEEVPIFMVCCRGAKLIDGGSRSHAIIGIYINGLFWPLGGGYRGYTRSHIDLQEQLKKTIRDTGKRFSISLQRIVPKEYVEKLRIEDSFEKIITPFGQVITQGNFVLYSPDGVLDFTGSNSKGELHTFGIPEMRILTMNDCETLQNFLKKANGIVVCKDGTFDILMENLLYDTIPSSETWNCSSFVSLFTDALKIPGITYKGRDFSIPTDKCRFSAEQFNYIFSYLISKHPDSFETDEEKMSYIEKCKNVLRMLNGIEGFNSTTSREKRGNHSKSRVPIDQIAQNEKKGRSRKRRRGRSRSRSRERSSSEGGMKKMYRKTQRKRKTYKHK